MLRINQITKLSPPGESYKGNEMTLYKNYLRSQLGDVHIKSFNLADDPRIDLIKSLSVHPFDQVL